MAVKANALAFSALLLKFVPFSIIGDGEHMSLLSAVYEAPRANPCVHLIFPARSSHCLFHLS